MSSVLWSVPKGETPQRLALEMVLTTVVTKAPAFLSHHSDLRCQEGA